MNRRTYSVQNTRRNEDWFLHILDGNFSLLNCFWVLDSYLSFLFVFDRLLVKNVECWLVCEINLVVGIVENYKPLLHSSHQVQVLLDEIKNATALF